MNKVAEGFILSSKLYKESDGMMSIYLEDNELKRFIFKGLYKPTSKRLAQSQLFVKYQFTYKSTSSLTTPIEIVTITTYSDILENVQKSILGQIFNLIFLNFHEHLDYSLYLWSIERLNETTNLNLILSMLLVQVLNELGLQPFVDGDVVTGDSIINHFDIEKGGFVFRHLQPKFTKKELQMIRKLFKAKPENYSIIKGDSIEMRIVQSIIDYFEFHTSFRLRGIELYQNI